MKTKFKKRKHGTKNQIGKVFPILQKKNLPTRISLNPPRRGGKIIQLASPLSGAPLEPPTELGDTVLYDAYSGTFAELSPERELGRVTPKYTVAEAAGMGMAKSYVSQAAQIGKDKGKSGASLDEYRKAVMLMSHAQRVEPWHSYPEAGLQRNMVFRQIKDVYPYITSMLQSAVETEDPIERQKYINRGMESIRSLDVAIGSSGGKTGRRRKEKFDIKEFEREAALWQKIMRSRGGKLSPKVKITFINTHGKKDTVTLDKKGQVEFYQKKPYLQIISVTGGGKIAWVERAGIISPQQKERALGPYKAEIQEAFARGEVPNVEKIDTKYGQPLDKNVVPLLHALNRKGFKTTGSCGGHQYPDSFTKAYVVMDLDARQRRALREKLSGDEDVTIEGPGIKRVRGELVRNPWTAIDINANNVQDTNRIIRKLADKISSSKSGGKINRADLIKALKKKDPKGLDDLRIKLYLRDRIKSFGWERRAWKGGKISSKKDFDAGYETIFGNRKKVPKTKYQHPDKWRGY